MGSDLHTHAGGGRDLLFSSSDLPPLDDLLFADGTRGLGSLDDPPSADGTDGEASAEPAPTANDPIVPELALSRPVLADTATDGAVAATPARTATGVPAPRPTRRRRRSRPTGRSDGLAALLGTADPERSTGDADRTRNRRIGVATGMVACLAVLAALLVPTGGDGESETSADTPEAAAEARASGAALSGFDASGRLEGLLGDQPDDPSDAGSTVAAVIDYARLDEPWLTGSSTEVGESDDSTDPTVEDGSATTDGDGDTTAAGSSTTTTGSSTTADDSTTATSEATSTSGDPSTTSTTDATTSSTTCSGVTWDPVLDEQFNGSAFDTGTWQPYDSVGNAGFGLRSPSALSVSGGLLNITAQMLDGTLVSGGMRHAISQQYGRYEFRVRTDQDPSEATSGVILTLPSSNVHPRDGENDIYETLGAPGDRREFYSFIHKPFGTAGDQDQTVHPTSAASWHTMAMEWTPSWIKLYRDGSLVKTIDETAADLIPDNPHYLAVQLDATSDTVAANITMQIDYVKVWSYGGGC
ncbi:MAG: glycoside hydrolase family 16 protein [Acidimicrobiia bacterium]|nr:glycoside hydrolase family 16 protein [Acidimicrobiia bacterium]